MEKGKNYKYFTEITGSTKVHSIKSDFTIKIKNEIIYKGVDEENNLHRFLVKEIEYDLSKYEDPIMAQIAEMTNKICSIYQELDIGVNGTGTIKKMYNKNDIRKKWQLIKEWLTNKHPLESYDIIRAKELELSNDDLELKNVGFIHFLQQYFYIFGRQANSTSTSYIRKDEMDRFGAGIVIPITLGFTQKNEDGKLVKRFEGKMTREENVIGRLRNFAKDKFMHPEYTMKGKYTYEDNLLAESDFTITEELGEHYYTHTFLHLKLEE